MTGYFADLDHAGRDPLDADYGKPKVAMTVPAPSDPTPEEVARGMCARDCLAEELDCPGGRECGAWDAFLDLAQIAISMINPAKVRQEALGEAAERARKVGRAWRDDADTAAEKQDFHRANNASYVASGAEEAAAEIALMTEPGPKETTP